MIEKITLKGQYKIIVFEDGKIVNKIIIDNAIMKLQAYQMADILQGSTGDLELRYCAIGTGTNPTTINDTKLQTEYFRVFRGALARDGYKVIAEFNFLKSEANTDWKEIGVFCGTNATSTVNAGKLWSKAGITLNKTSSQEVLVQYSVNFTTNY